jgi:hypothetical protein
VDSAQQPNRGEKPFLPVRKTGCRLTSVGHSVAQGKPPCIIVVLTGKILQHIQNHGKQRLPEIPEVLV